jgi:hypothetical protein
LGEKLDDMVQCYVTLLREKGGIINTSIVIAGERGILKSRQLSRLAKFGGPATLSKAWATSLLRRMHFTKRRGTTKSSVSPEEFNKFKAAFLLEIVDIVVTEEIPLRLISNWNQTGLNLVPVSSWTMALKGSKRIKIKGVNDKRPITGLFCGTGLGEFVPI